MVSINKLRYKIIPNFLNETEIDLLKTYCKLQHFNNRTNFDLVQNNNADTYFYKDPLIETISSKKRSLIEKEINI